MSASFHLSARNLDKKDLFGKSDGFLRISRPTDAAFSQFVAVHQTEVVMKTLNPTWKPFTIPLYKLCGNNPKVRKGKNKNRRCVMILIPSL